MGAGTSNKHRLAGTRSDQLLDNEHIFKHPTSLPSSLMMVLRISLAKDNAIKVYVGGTVKVGFCSRKMMKFYFLTRLIEEKFVYVQRSQACCKRPAVPLRTEAKISIDLLEMTASKWSR